MRISFRNNLRRNDLIHKYNSKLLEEKEDYKKKKGLKIARGFSKTKEYKRIKRNKKAALLRYDNRNNASKLWNQKKGELLYSEKKAMPYHLVLSYGSGTDRLAASLFRLVKLFNAKPIVYFFFDRKIGNFTGYYNMRSSTYYEFLQNSRIVYSDLNDYSDFTNDYVFVQTSIKESSKEVSIILYFFPV